MSSPKRRGKEDNTPKQPWAFDATVMVCLESCDGHRIFADRNCVATARRLADLIPPLVAPPPPPVAPARGAAKNEPPPPPPKNRGPSAVTPLFASDIAPCAPAHAGKLTVGSSDTQLEKSGRSPQVASLVEQTPVIPVIKCECLDGRQLEAAMRVAYLKYLGDYTSDEKARKTISLEKLEITPEELMAIGTILGS